MKSSKKQAEAIIQSDVPTIPEQIRGKYLGNATNNKQRIVARIILIAVPMLLIVYVLIKLFILKEPLFIG